MIVCNRYTGSASVRPRRGQLESVGRGEPGDRCPLRECRAQQRGVDLYRGSTRQVHSLRGVTVTRGRLSQKPIALANVKGRGFGWHHLLNRKHKPDSSHYGLSAQQSLSTPY